MVAARFGVLAGAAAVLALGVVVAGRGDRAAAIAGAAARYVCPMHPEVRSRARGECPICGMALLEAGTFSRDDGAAASPTAPDAQEGVAVAELLSRAAGGLAPNLLGYYPAPVRRHVLRYELRAPAWVEAPGVAVVLLYGDQLPTLDPVERATFSPTADPGRELEVALAPDAPERWDRSTSLVRFRFASVAGGADAGAPSPPPGTVGWVRFPPRPRSMQVVPAGAVLQSAGGPYVLVFSRQRGTAGKRPVEIGRTTVGMAAVLSGLSLREEVVSANAFFWDAERRLKVDRRAGGAP